MELTVEKTDLKAIGHTQYKNDEGNLDVVCTPETANIEGILLRNILKCYGDYEIVDMVDFLWYEDTTDICFVTNMPYPYGE